MVHQRKLIHEGATRLRQVVGKAFSRLRMCFSKSASNVMIMEYRILDLWFAFP
jgi:hypothetical protein